MKVYFHPAKSSGNKYIYNFVSGLEEVGVDIINKSNKNCSIFNFKDLFVQDRKILHLNWVLKKAQGFKFKHYFRTYKFMLWIKFLKILGYKIVWTMHNKVPHRTENLFFVLKFRKFLIKNSDKIIIHCEESKDILKEVLTYKELTSKIEYLPHGHYIGNYKNIEDDFREEFSIGDNEIVFQFLGQIQPYKNLDLLIRAFNELQFKEAKLLICGRPADDRLEEQLRALIGDNEDIIFINKFISDDEIVKYLNTADLLVLPYQKRSVLNSGSIYMALSYKKPVLTSRIGTVKDINNDFILNYDYSEDNDDHYLKLKEKLNYSYNLFIEDRKRFKSMGEKGYKYVKKNNDWKAISRKIYDIYSQLLKN